ncbi:MAG: hypothetical protein H6772_02220 [Pseudomonadales bacterium]|nr:hypothetical protein [Pseudomonadales bacterium]
MNKLNKLFLAINVILLIILVFSGIFLFKNSQQESHELNRYSKTVCDVAVEQNEKTNIEIFEGEPKLVNFESNPDAKLFRTTITNQVAEGANFAGHYTMATWGCGTNCIGYAIVDVLTGDIIDYVPYYPSQTITGFGFSIDKNILVFNPKIPTDENGYQSNGYKEERTVAEIVEEDYSAGYGRIYYDLVESTDDTMPLLRKLCTENVYSGLVK